MREHGFTLVESIMTILLLGILAMVTIPFLRQATEAYLDAQSYADLTAHGRQAMERLSRELRNAVPNSVQTVAGGQGVEFVHAVHVARYTVPSEQFDQDPGCGSARAFNDVNKRFRASNSRNALYVLDDETATIVAGVLGSGGSPSLVIGNTTPADLSTASTSDRTWVGVSGTSATTCANDRTDDGTIVDFSAGKSFPLGSLGQRLYIADRTVEVGVESGTLRWHERDGIDTAIYNNASADWSTADPILVDGVTNATFSYTPGSVNAAGVLGLTLELSDRRITVTLHQDMRVRNVP